MKYLFQYFFLVTILIFSLISIKLSYDLGVSLEEYTNTKQVLFSSMGIWFVASLVLNKINRNEKGEKGIATENWWCFFWLGHGMFIWHPRSWITPLSFAFYFLYLAGEAWKYPVLQTICYQYWIIAGAFLILMFIMASLTQTSNKSLFRWDT